MPLPKERIYTIDDIYALPDGERAELIDGQIYMMAPPNTRHQVIVGELYATIRNYIKGKGGSCKPYVSPFAVFLNEDRHMHNIAVLMNGKGDYAYCPIFDNGAGLLADTTMDYPLTGDIYTLMEKVQSQTICNAFDEQLDISESLYKMNLKFRFTKKDVTELLANAEGYSDEIRKRVETIIFAQMRKYPYLFSKT